MRDKEKDAAEKAARKQSVMESGFRLFSEKGIDLVSMPDVAKASNLGRASLYRYFSTKQELVIAIGAWKWEEYFREAERKFPLKERENWNAVTHLEFYLDSFLDLYRNHKDILRFNHLFNAFVVNERVEAGQMQPYMEIIRKLLSDFHHVYEKAREDHTLRTDISEEMLSSCVLHIMLAAVTRYASGLVFTLKSETGKENDPEDELILLKNMLLKEFSEKAQ